MLLKPTPKACPRRGRGASAEGAIGGREREGVSPLSLVENFEILVRFGAIWGLRSEILLVYLKIVFYLIKLAFYDFLLM